MTMFQFADDYRRNKFMHFMASVVLALLLTVLAVRTFYLGIGPFAATPVLSVLGAVMFAVIWVCPFVALWLLITASERAHRFALDKMLVR